MEEDRFQSIVNALDELNLDSCCYGGGSGSGTRGNAGTTSSSASASAARTGSTTERRDAPAHPPRPTAVHMDPTSSSSRPAFGPTAPAAAPPYARAPPAGVAADVPNRMTYQYELRLTKMCRRGEECSFLNRIDGSCDGCWFAHTRDELRCKQFAMFGRCPEGDRCSMKHTLAPYKLAALANGADEDGSVGVGSGGSLPSSSSAPAAASGARGQQPVSFGQRPDANRRMNYVRRLPKHSLPQSLRIANSRVEAVARGGFGSNINNDHLRQHFKLPSLNSTRQQQQDTRVSVHEACQTTRGTQNWLRRSLELECAQQLSDVRRYDIEHCILPQSREYHRGGRPFRLYSIFCAGLQEKRPSVLCNDTIKLRDNNTGLVHGGYVHFVNLDSVDVNFDRAYFRPKPNITYHVEFCLSRTTFNRQFHALNTVDTVFAGDDEFNAAPPDNSFGGGVSYVKQMMRRIAPASVSMLNDLQAECVRRLKQYDPKPGQLGLFLLHGPPGTGKTTTLVAFLHWFVHANRGSSVHQFTSGVSQRALVCCPSNHAADLICEKLIGRFPDDEARAVAGKQVLRVCSHTYDISKASPAVQRCTSPRDATPDELLHLASTATVVVCTLMGSGVLWDMGVDTDSFDHIVIDEAGQALETEILVPLQFASKEKGVHITLAGDPCQLGPIVRSRECERFDFGRSTLKRLITNTHRHDKHCVQLTESYRAHPEILRLYNTLTYHNTLEAKGCETQTRALENCHLFPVPGRPVAFFHVDGTESREADSPSWMNLEEAYVTIQTVEILLLGSDQQAPVSFSDIVIMTPYNKQIKKISGILHYLFETHKMDSNSAWYCPEYDRKRPPVKVCSVEMFQGREAKVVIMSCVRSKRSEEIGNDVLQSIGFLRQPQRMNVAISRPIAGLIIIGNVGVLQQDEGWRRLILMLSSDVETESSVVGILMERNHNSATNGAPPYKAVGMTSPLTFGDLEAVYEIVKYTTEAAAAAAAEGTSADDASGGGDFGRNIRGVDRADGEWHRSE